MKDILSDEGLPALDQVARERMVLAFDFDGTLAPLVDDPGAACLPASTRALLRLVAVLQPCCVISGRARADLAPRLDGIPLVAVVGNHGAEAGHGPVDQSARDSVKAWAGAARAWLRGLRGVEVEDKGLSLAIHWRRAAAPAEAARAAEDFAARLAGARVFPGNAVLNVVPPDLHDKGAALSRVLERVGRRRAVYVGDDISDEDAFRSEGVHLAIRVGAAPASAAAWCVPSQAHVDELLRAVVRARRRLDGLPDGTAGLERMLAW
jgi:trehalose 6-phosphate phosphatase